MNPHHKVSEIKDTLAKWGTEYASIILGTANQLPHPPGRNPQNEKGERGKLTFCASIPCHPLF